MRHAYISTTTKYGEVPLENNRTANSAVVRSILNRKSAEMPPKKQNRAQKRARFIGLEIWVTQ